MTDLLSLVMIVKNEAASIERTIASVVDVVDRYTILDTGSTDGTPDRIRRAFGDTPGQIVFEPFVDYGTTRSRALELDAESCVFQLMLSGDETVYAPQRLREFCVEHRDFSGSDHAAYLVATQLDASRLLHPRLTRSRMKMRYVGLTHERLERKGVPPPQFTVPDVLIAHDITSSDQNRRRETFLRDLGLLRRTLEATPDDARAQFYFAQTLECLGLHAEALNAYQRRVRLGGWEEERYEALFRVGRTSEALSLPWEVTQARYLEAFAARPHRAEPLYRIALHWYREQQFHLSHLFARRAFELPYPKADVLWVDNEVHHFALPDLLGIVAYYVGDFEAGERAARRALAARPHDERVQKNLGFYLERRQEAA